MCKAAVAIVHCHRRVEVDCLGIEVNGLVKFVLWVCVCGVNVQHYHNACVVARIKISIKTSLTLADNEKIRNWKFLVLLDTFMGKL